MVMSGIAMQNYNDFWYNGDDGLRLYARDYAHKTPGHVIICLPGLSRNSKDFSQLCEHLNKSYRVLAVDFRGRGKSDYDNNPTNYQPAVYMGDMLALLNSLQLEKVILIGTSLGGLVSMLLTSVASDRIAAVILNDIGPEINLDGLERIKNYIGKDAPCHSWNEAITAVKAVHGSEYPDFTQQQWRDFANNLYREDDSGNIFLDYDKAIAVPMQSEDNQASAAVDLWPVFEAMTKLPLLLIRGKFSDILSTDCVDKIRQRHPRLHYCELSNRGHAPLLTEPPCIKAIDHFLATIAQDGE